MDHETAVRIQAAERYVLEEFPPEERTAFEEHFFECPECAEEVRSASIFAANATQALTEERAKELERSVGRPSRRFWWTLATSAALNLALIVGIGVERLPTRSAPAASEIQPQFYPTVAVAAASRGGQAVIAVPEGAQFLGVRFDVLPGQKFEGFEYQILDAKSAVRSVKSLPAPAGESQELQLAVPIASLEPGEYVLVLRGKQSGNSTEIGRRTFSLPR